MFQIQALLADKRVTEGLALARNARKIGLNKEQYRKVRFTKCEVQTDCNGISENP